MRVQSPLQITRSHAIHCGAAAIRMSPALKRDPLRHANFFKRATHIFTVVRMSGRKRHADNAPSALVQTQSQWLANNVRSWRAPSRFLGRAFEKLDNKSLRSGYKKGLQIVNVRPDFGVNGVTRRAAAALNTCWRRSANRTSPVWNRVKRYLIANQR